MLQINAFEKSSGNLLSQDSQKYPNHPFKLGHFSSSYDDGGFQRFVRARTQMDMSDIFGATLGEFRRVTEKVFLPDWKASLLRAIQTREIFNVFIRQFGDDILYKVPRACEPGQHPVWNPTAFELISSVTTEFDKLSGCQPLNVKGIIPTRFYTFLICSWNAKFAEPIDYYNQGLDIIVESCEWVLQQSNPQDFYLRWDP